MMYNIPVVPCKCTSRVCNYHFNGMREVDMAEGPLIHSQFSKYFINFILSHNGTQLKPRQSKKKKKKFFL